MLAWTQLQGTAGVSFEGTEVAKCQEQTHRTLFLGGRKWGDVETVEDTFGSTLSADTHCRAHSFFLGGCKLFCGVVVSTPAAGRHLLQHSFCTPWQNTLLSGWLQAFLWCGSSCICRQLPPLQTWNLQAKPSAVHPGALSKWPGAQRYMLTDIASGTTQCVVTLLMCV